MEHFFVDADPADLQEQADVHTVEPEAGPVQSVTRFLSLPRLTPRVSNKARTESLDFTKSLMLTSQDYINVVSAKRQAQIEAAEEKERNRVQREERKKAKAAEVEAGKRERAALRATKEIQREAARATKAAEKMRKAMERDRAKR